MNLFWAGQISVNLPTDHWKIKLDALCLGIIGSSLQILRTLSRTGTLDAIATRYTSRNRDECSRLSNRFMTGTTELFLERLGLSSLTDLPDIAPLLPDVDMIDDLSESLDAEPRFVKLGGGPVSDDPPLSFDVDHE